MAYNNLRRCLNERVCPVCGKLFYCFVVSEWAYHYRDEYNNKRITCSYSCKNKRERRDKTNA